MERIARSPILPAVLLILMTGCDENHRVAQVAREAADRQAEQNRQIARQSQEVSSTTKALVEADAQARKDVLEAQQQLQGQQAEVGRQRDQLEAERKAIAGHRQWDPVVAQAITAGVALLACMAPLVIAWYLLRTVHDEQADPELTEMLVEELASPEPKLLPPAVPTLPTLDAEAVPEPALPPPSAVDEEDVVG